MSVLCETALALGLTFMGICAEDATEDIYMPKEDPTIWAHMEAQTLEPPAPKPEQAPRFPPVIITQVIEKEIIKEVAVPPKQTAAQSRPVKQEKADKKASDPVRAWLESGGGTQRRRVTSINTRLNNMASDVSAARLQPFAKSSVSRAGTKQAALKTSDEEYDYASRTSGLPVDNTRILGADRFISGILETSINSQIASGDGGDVIIQTSRDVFGYHGRSILIPKGSRMLCEYEGADAVGSTRLSIICKRILMAGHRAEIIELKTPLGNAQGQPGVSGDVDNRFSEKYGTAFVLAGISAAVRMASALAADGNSETSTAQSILEAGSTDLSQKLGEISATILEETVNLKPIITIPQGTRVQIRAQADWYIRKIKPRS